MYEQMGQQNARELVGRLGEVREVYLNPNGGIDVLFSSGTVATLGSLFKYGYSGSGPIAFSAWLREVGFLVTDGDVSNMTRPMVLRHPKNQNPTEQDFWEKRAQEEARKRQEEEKRRQEAEAKRKAEEQRRAKVQEQRKSTSQCVMCGRALTFFQKLLGKDRHGACTTFVDVPAEATAAQKGGAATPVTGQLGMVLFLFNSDTPPADADAGYGTFSESKLLKHLFSRWSQQTGQDIANAEIKACHGDLFERHPLGGSACTLNKLGKMMQEKKLDGSRLRAEFDLALRKGATVGFIPWAIGLFPIPDSVTRAVHEALKAELPEFYLGVLSLPPSYEFESTASNLALPQTMRIRKGQLVGDWQGKAP